MAKVAIANVKTGMKLLKPVINDSGMVMLGEGTILTDQMINKLNNMNISFVYVEGSQAKTKSKEALINEINERFQKSGTNEQMVLLHKLMIEHIEETYK
ncbi:MAG TPA: hypothetical protein HPP56_01790 [Nitrospirae bacterium]|nr:hypothetical protein [Nitrospirota bacterium]